MSEPSSSSVFPRSFTAQYPIAVRGEGVYLYDQAGRRYLDACGGAAVVTIGYGVAEVTDAIARTLRELPYVHSSQFHTRQAEELAALLAARFPGPQPAAAGARVHFTSGGSEATETAIKTVRQYWISRGQPERVKFYSRWHSYHGTTLGALALSGNRLRRAPYEALLPATGHISACFCYHCPLGLKFPDCELACAEELETALHWEKPGTVAAFILEPIVGATSGAVPPEGYLRRIREICDRHGVLLIADEVMTGCGRTGKYFAVEHWDVVPDIILLGKGLSSGYAPLGAVLISEQVTQAIEQGTKTLHHGFTYQMHPPSVAAGLAVQQYVERNHLVARAQDAGAALAQRLERLCELPCVGDVRGKGMLQTVEFVADRDSRRPFPPEAQFAPRVYEALRERGVLVYPMRGTADGAAGDHVLIAPPFIIGETEMDFLAEQLRAVLQTIS